MLAALWAVVMVYVIGITPLHAHIDPQHPADIRHP